MAKNGDASLLPKRIGGRKVPRTIRKGAGALAALLTSPEDRRFAAQVLTALAAALSQDPVRGGVAAEGSVPMACGGEDALDAAPAGLQAPTVEPPVPLDEDVHAENVSAGTGRSPPSENAVPRTRSRRRVAAALHPPD